MVALLLDREEREEPPERRRAMAALLTSCREKAADTLDCPLAGCDQAVTAERPQHSNQVAKVPQSAFSLVKIKRRRKFPGYMSGPSTFSFWC